MQRRSNAAGTLPRAVKAPSTGGYTRIVTRTYIAVLVVQAAVLAALWFLSRYFAA